MHMTQFVELDRELLFFVEALEGPEHHLIIREDDADVNFLRGNYADIVLPSSIDTHETNDQNRAIYLWLVLQQLGFRQFGTLQFNFETISTQITKFSRPTRSTGHRATEFEKLFAVYELTDLASCLFQLLETARIEPLILREYPGSQRLRLSAQRFFQNQFKEQPHTGEYSLPRLQAGLRGIEKLPYALAVFLRPIFQASASVYTTVQVLDEWYQHIVSQEEISVRESIADLQDDMPIEMRQRMARLDQLEQDLEQMDNQGFATELLLQPNEESEAEPGKNLEGLLREKTLEFLSERDQIQRVIDVERSTLGLAVLGQNRPSTKFHYHEWNFLTQSYIPNHCTVHERPAHADPNTDTASLLNQITPYIRQVRKQFEQLRPTGLRKIKHVIDGDDIDIDSLLTCRIDLKAGYSSDERLFSRRVRTQRDVSAVLLVDLSASTDYIVEDEQETESKSGPSSKTQDLRDPFFDDDDDPYLHGALNFDSLERPEDKRKRILDIEREAVLMLATALEDLGDLYAIFGFSGYGHDNVEIEVAKEFNQALNPHIVNSLASLKPMRSTRMGPAIRHASWYLQNTGTAMKLLLVISDGFPQDHDYGPDRSSHEYGIQDTSKALQEAHMEGIQTFCVTVDRSGHDYLRKMCADQRYLVIEEAKELAFALQKVYQQLSAT